jgi:peptide/nickel transport system substrate-binding protein
VTGSGAESVGRRPRIAVLWRERRARWTLPLVIIVIIGFVAIVDHLGSHRIRQVDAQTRSALVPATGGDATVELDQPWSGFNPNTPVGAASSSTTLLTSVLPSAYVIDSNLVPEVNTNLLSSVEVTSTSPLTIQYVINPSAVWSDGVPVSADDFIYAWQSQNGNGVDIDGQPDQVVSTLGYRDVASVTASHGGKTVTVVFATPFTDWRVMFDDLVPAHIARRVGWNHGFDTFNPAIDISAGPLELQSVSAGGTAVLVRNPKWWGTPSIMKRVVVNVARNQQSWTGELAQSNQAVAQPNAFNLGTLDAVSSLPNTQSFIKPSLNLLQLEFNVTSAVTMRAAARQAIAHVIDRTALLNKTFGPIDPTLVVNQDHLATASQADYQESSAAGEYSAPDLTTTDRLLKSIGYHQDPAGTYLDADGKPLTLRMAVESGDPWIDSVAGLISSQLRSAGISVVTVPVDGAQGMVAAAAANTYDMALVTRVASPFQSSTAAWFSDGLGVADSNGSQDWSKFDDPQVDALFIQAAEALNPVSGASVYAQIDDQLWDQMVALPLFEEPGLEANGVQVANVQYNASSDGILWNVPLWTTLKPGPPNH